jgi:hypothetical protein
VVDESLSFTADVACMSWIGGRPIPLIIASRLETKFWRTVSSGYSILAVLSRRTASAFIARLFKQTLESTLLSLNPGLQ